MKFQESFSLRKLNSFGLNSTARWFCEAINLEELSEAVEFAKERSLRIFLLGAGTNLILGNHIDGLVIKNNLRGKTFSENEVKASSGESWEELVMSCYSKGFPGLENLGLIPGTVGAAPIQNIGAYGVELSDRLKSVEALNLFTSETVAFSNTDCEFSYRDSRFKKEKEWCLTSVTISSGNELVFEYPDVRIYLEKHDLEMSSRTIYRAVCAARERKLPDLRRFPNVGSFFKNPVVTSEKYKILESHFPNIPGYVDRHGIKLSAAWLIDSLGLKGESIGGVSISRQHALVLINDSAGTFDDLKKISEFIKMRVHSAYDVSLEIEPEIVPDEPI
ncbi:MAG: UDP-N-acetylmuramate dehydrogenase [Candidatus Azotimanducaceae bacterium]